MQYIFLEKNVNIMDLLVTELRDGFPGGRGGGGVQACKGVLFFMNKPKNIGNKM